LRDGKFVVNAPPLLHRGVRLLDGEIRRDLSNRHENRNPPLKLWGGRLTAQAGSRVTRRQSRRSVVARSQSPSGTRARDTVRELRDHGGYPNAAMPSRPVTMERKRTLRNGERIDDRWAATLSYFPSSANLEIDLSLTLAWTKASAKVLRESRSRTASSPTAPLAGCTVDGNQVVFSAVMLPIPFLIDRFTRHLRGRYACRHSRADRSRVDEQDDRRVELKADCQLIAKSRLTWLFPGRGLVSEGHNPPLTVQRYGSGV
jgi:hypothetical protein